MTINKEGLPLISLVLGGSLCFLIAGVGLQLPVLTVIAAIGFLKAGFFCYFFRDPERYPPPTYEEGKNLLAPADGKVLEIVNEADNTNTIRIFLSVFNVHVQRSPAEGRIVKIERKKGVYLPAMNKSAHAENDQNIITIETSSGEKIVVKQIVGILARRLVLWKKEGDSVKAGERIGMIKFGSQVDITFPETYKSLVSAGDVVSGGTSIIAQKAH